MPGKLLPSLLLLASSLSLPAQTRTAPAESTVPAIFLSDIHLDPFHDPAKVARLNAAPAIEWPTILAGPDSDPHSPTAAKLALTCIVRGTDTPNTLWLSSLHALRTQAATTHPRFLTISGDLLAHQFDCKYKALLPDATHEQYVAFTEKAIHYLLTSLQAAVPNTPIYATLGNNDSGCKDYQLAPAHDEFLAAVAKEIAEVLPAADRPAVLASVPELGSFSAPLPGVPNTRIIVLDDLFLSTSYAQCGGGKNPAPAEAQISWLNTQLADARAHKERVWIMGHIPPSIDLYNTARRLTDVCSGGRPIMYLSSGALADSLAKNSDIIRLALFGHTHGDEIELVAPEASEAATPGVPVKLTASISPVNGNRPSYTVAQIDPAAATLKDFTVFEASNPSGVGTTWTREYTYSAAYNQPAFDAASVKALIEGFQADPRAETQASKSYLKYVYPGDISSLIAFAWPQYACSENHQTADSYAACVCKGKSHP